jgi:hypothetical protein
MDAKIIIGQAFGILATVICLISYQMNTKKSLLIVQTAGTACTCISYFFLGATSGFVLNIVCIVRNFVFYFVGGKKSLYASLVFAVATCVVGAFSWEGFISLLIIIPLAVNTVCLSLGRPQLLRYSILFTSTSIMIYNIFVFSIGGTINEALTVISAFIGILRFRTGKTKEQESVSVEKSEELSS